MTSTYTPTYYTSLHESITSICKTILPFSFKKRRIPAIAAAEQRLSKQQSDNLKWQQEAFHQLLKLMGLCKQEILHENEVYAFRTHLIETITESTIDHEPAVILRDKLIFLQDLFYAKCITEDEYHASKRPLLQRLAVQGAKIIRESDVIVGARDEISNEDWSAVVIDMKGKKQSLVVNSERFMSNNSNEGSSVSAFVLPDKNGNREEGKDASGSGIIRLRDGNIRNKLMLSTENPFWNSCLDGSESETLSTENPFWNSCLDGSESETKSILMADNEKQSGDEKGKRKPFGTLFKRNENEEVHGVVPSDEHKEKIKLVKRTWGVGGFRKWKKNKSEDETAPFPLIGISDHNASYNGRIVTNPTEEGTDTEKIKKKLHQNGSQPDFTVDEVNGEHVKKELSQIKAQVISTRSPRVHLSDDQIEETSIRHPVDNGDLKKFFPGDAVLDVVREIGNFQVTPEEKRQDPKTWTMFDDEENIHPNLFAPQDHSYSMNARTCFNGSSIDQGLKYNPFIKL